MFRHSPKLQKLALGIFVAWALVSARASAAEYKLGAGDVLEISVYGLPELLRKVTVNGMEKWHFHS